MSVNEMPRPRRQCGTAAVEFALLAALFFLILFGIMEVARMLYVYGTLQEVTRRAASSAAHVYPTDGAGIARLKYAALFRTGPGELPLAPPVSDTHLRIDYLALTRDPADNKLSLAPVAPGSIPNSAARNRQICMANPNAVDCIRFVQVRICGGAVDGAGECPLVRSRILLPFVDMRMPLHRATTIVPVESFGYQTGDSPCPCT
jgi:hypothetical protein